MSQSGVLACAIAVLGSFACQTGVVEDEPVGSLEVALVSTAPSGTRYRLSNATLELTGPTNETVSLDGDSDTIRSNPLGVGTYGVTLRDGWRIERLLADGTTEIVVASYKSASSEQITILAEQITTLTLSFTIGEEDVEFDLGKLRVRIQLTELEGRPCVLKEVCIGGFFIGEQVNGNAPLGTLAPLVGQQVRFVLGFDIAGRAVASDKRTATYQVESLELSTNRPELRQLEAGISTIQERQVTAWSDGQVSFNFICDDCSPDGTGWSFEVDLTGPAVTGPDGAPILSNQSESSSEISIRRRPVYAGITGHAELSLYVQ